MTEPSEQTSLLHHSSLSRHELAAWIIDETMRGLPVKHARSIPRTRANRTAYLFFENTLFIRQAVTLLLVLLTFFEYPSYCSPTRQCLSPDGSSLFLSGLPYLSPFHHAMVNATLLSVLTFFVIFDAVVLPGFELQPYAKLLKILLAALVADFFFVALCAGFPPVRLAPYMRALLPLFYWNALKECTLSISAVISPFIDVVSIVALFVLVFGWIVTLLFHDVPEADTYFGNLSVGLYSAFTSITTADWPVQIMAVLDVSRASALMFLVFIVLGVFLLFNVLLAVVYNAYTGHIEELVVERLEARRESIGFAYDVLVGDNNFCELLDIKLMFQELRKNKAHSAIDDERVELVFTALDDNADDNLSKHEFLDIVQVLQFKFVFELEDKSPVETLFPHLFAMPFWKSVASYARSKSFTYHINIVMLINLVFVLVETTMDLRKQDTPASQQFFATIECAFSFVYILEMALKVASQGFDRYWRDLGNKFDFMVTWLLLFGAAFVLYPYSENDPEVVRYLVLLRCLRLFSVLADVPRFRRIVQVFSTLVPASVPLFSFFFLSLYVFAAVGVELFGGLIYASNPALDPALHPSVDPYTSSDYWALNFNDVASGWYTLFSAVIVAYFTEIAAAIAAASRFGDWTKWFFILNFIVNTLIVSNCVVAFVVDLFIMEDEAEEDETYLELQSRYGAKRVKVLQSRSTATEVYGSMFRQRVQEIFNRDLDSQIA